MRQHLSAVILGTAIVSLTRGMDPVASGGQPSPSEAAGRRGASPEYLAVVPLERHEWEFASWVLDLSEDQWRAWGDVYDALQDEIAVAQEALSERMTSEREASLAEGHERFGGSHGFPAYGRYMALTQDHVTLVRGRQDAAIRLFATRLTDEQRIRLEGVRSVLARRLLMKRGMELLAIREATVDFEWELIQVCVQESIPAELAVHWMEVWCPGYGSGLERALVASSAAATRLRIDEMRASLHGRARSSGAMDIEADDVVAMFDVARESAEPVRRHVRDLVDLQLNTARTLMVDAAVPVAIRRIVTQRFLPRVYPDEMRFMPRLDPIRAGLDAAGPSRGRLEVLLDDGARSLDQITFDMMRVRSRDRLKVGLLSFRGDPERDGRAATSSELCALAERRVRHAIQVVEVMSSAAKDLKELQRRCAVALDQLRASRASLAEQCDAGEYPPY